MKWDILSDISVWVIILPVSTVLFTYKRFNKDAWIIYSFVIAGLIPQVLSSFLKNNDSILIASYNIYSPFEFGILFILFKSKVNRHVSLMIIKISGIIFILVYGYFIVSVGVSNRFFNEMVVFDNVMYLIWILLFIYEQFLEKEPIVRSREPFAWMLLALMIFTPCTIMNFAMFHYVRTHPSLSFVIRIMDVCNILLYVLAAVALLVSKKQLPIRAPVEEV